jgi:hypothetical protein
MSFSFLQFRGENMAKSHYSFKKRKKEMARKLKQEQKRQRKLEKGSVKAESDSDEIDESGEDNLNRNG